MIRVKPDLTTNPTTSTVASPASTDGTYALVEEMLKLRGSVANDVVIDVEVDGVTTSLRKPCASPRKCFDLAMLAKANKMGRQYDVARLERMLGQHCCYLHFLLGRRDGGGRDVGEFSARLIFVVLNA
ncbi:unnamed protein product [Dovyalis caffra]|uniref:Uncharacterized protein n=1 Tax=Dovyalis caffra TaxID=77055 RepID=A0AAV1RKM0_9ROSI|nr:unnamed protein product [Dovyalis caffra]